MDAIILAGGLGTRLRPAVSDIPKSMAPVAGKPFLSYLLDWLTGRGIDNVILSVGYLREHIFKWIEKHGAEYPFKFLFAEESTPLGTGGGIRLALSKTSSDKVLVINGDTFFDADVSALASTDAAVTLALKPMKDFSRYGSVQLDAEGNVTGFAEKRYLEEGLINGGIYVVDKTKLDLRNYPTRFSFEKDVLEPLAGNGKLRGVICDGYFIDIGIPSDYTKAELHWSGYDTLLLDRDGVINVLRPGDYVKSWEEFEFIPEFLKAIPEWSSKFRNIFIVTNQRGVGKGLLSETELERIHMKMKEAIADAGGRIDGIYVCTAVEDSDYRRKPNPGMFEDILKEHPDVRRELTAMVGDKDSDMEFARHAGINGYKIDWK